MLTKDQVTDLYQTAEKTVHRTCAKYGWHPSPDDLLDIVQTVCVKSIESFNPERGTIGALAWRIATNEVANYLNDHSAHGARTDAMESTDEDGHMSTMDIPDDSTNAHVMLANAQRDAALKAAIGKLSPAERQAIEVHLDDDRALTGSERIAKMRATDALEESLNAAHFDRSAAKPRKASKSKRSERSELMPATEIRGLLRLQTITKHNYIATLPLKVLSVVQNAPSVDEGWNEAA
jgi:RNA polymerase sigma factor (sigma-70 family)